MFDNPGSFANSKVVIAPIVNPDGFLKTPSTRQNKNGIDLNRNFPTKDFDSRALVEWKSKEGGSKGKYPGEKGGSEIETLFQMMLIETHKPDKIISIHSPYGWLDVNTPTPGETEQDDADGLNLHELTRQANDIAQVMSRMSNNFRVKNFKVYPGSLGNYAARERGIPTYTLELESSDAVKGPAYWQRMRNAITAAIQYKLALTGDKKFKISGQGSGAGSTSKATN
jgi:protein MpaA